MYIYIYIYVFTYDYACVYIYIYIYIYEGEPRLHRDAGGGGPHARLARRRAAFRQKYINEKFNKLMTIEGVSFI